MTDLAQLPLPDRSCPLCPRLAEFRTVSTVPPIPIGTTRRVPPFGADQPPGPLIVGLRRVCAAAPRERPFTEGFAAVALATLTKFGLTIGDYGGHREDRFGLSGARIATRYAASCTRTARNGCGSPDAAAVFLAGSWRGRPQCAILALSAIAQQRRAHDQGHGVPPPFGHAAPSICPTACCSPTALLLAAQPNAGTLTTEMFEAVFAAIFGASQPRERMVRASSPLPAAVLLCLAFVDAFSCRGPGRGRPWRGRAR